ncbi:transcription factor Sp3 isoform X1, partial [Tachysurus ichikawai]
MTAPEQPVKQQEMAALDADGGQSDFLQPAAEAAAASDT